MCSTSLLGSKQIARAAQQGFVDFSFASPQYAKFRPDYPQTLFDEILMRVPQENRKVAVDIGAGTGQASIPLCKYFEKVTAYDPSPGMLKEAVEKAKLANLSFHEGTADKIDVADLSVDLVVAAQAAHWFNLPVFFKEVDRVLKPSGVLAIWGYSICRLENPDADKLVQEFYTSVRPYFHPNRQMVDDHYKDIKPPFPSVERITFEMKKCTHIESFLGYVSTWSGLNEYKQAHPEQGDPLTTLQHSLKAVMGSNDEISFHHPLFMMFAKKELH